MPFPSGRFDKTEGYRSTEYGARGPEGFRAFWRQIFLCGGDAFRSAGRGCPLRRTFVFYIFFIFNRRNHPPRGLPKTGGHKKVDTPEKLEKFNKFMAYTWENGDVNHDNYLSPEEFAAQRQRNREKFSRKK